MNTSTTPADSALPSGGRGPAGRAGRRPLRQGRFTGRLTQWRNWSLPVKLLAAALIPILFAVLLGALEIRTEVDRADALSATQQRVQATGEVRDLLDALHQERTGAAGLLAGVGSNDAQSVRSQGSRVSSLADIALATVQQLPDSGPQAGQRLAAVRDGLGTLPQLRDQVLARGIGADEAITRYTDVIASVLALNRLLTSTIEGPQLAATADASYELSALTEELSFQQAGVLALLGQQAPATITRQLQDSSARLGDRIATFRSVAASGQQQQLNAVLDSSEADQRRDLLGSVLASSNQATPDGAGSDEPGSLTQPAGFTPSEWGATSRAVATDLDSLGATLSDQVANEIGAQQSAASDRAGLITVVLLAALLIAAGVTALIARQMLQSIRTLRRGALRVADRDLPMEVAAIRRGEAGDDRPAAEPIPVTTTEEVGQLARAFDAVHDRALGLAGEQAQLRRNYGNVFVSLSRRSQTLVERLLGQLERLERDEEDPDQLSTLFQLDHLVTRMRRNNENLMVLSGTELGRRFDGAIPLSELLRAAVSEIEQYQRVTVQAPAEMHVIGYAAGDLVRLCSELLDNATQFSAPETRVTVASRLGKDGEVGIDILDDGIGITDTQLHTINARLQTAAASSEEVEVSTARQMGLFVVGRLAARHGAHVQLHGIGSDHTGGSGVRASVVLPSSVLTRTGNTGAGGPPTAPRQVTGPRPQLPGNGRTGPAAESEIASGAIDSGEPSPDAAVTAPQPVVSSNGVADARSAAASGASQAATSSASPAPSPELPGANSEAGMLFVPSDADQPSEAEAMVECVECGRTGQTTDMVDDRGEWICPVCAQQQPGVTAPAPNSNAPNSEGGAAQDGGEAHDTPIYEAMLSAWFQPSLPSSGGEPLIPDAPPVPAQAVSRDWDFAADSDLHRVRSATRTEPVGYTEAGLPRRQPRAHLMPGAVSSPAPGAGPASPASRAGRDPEHLRGRLQNLQQGLHAGRESLTPSAAEERSDPPALDTGERQFTAGGLPRRTPRANLLPGSAGPDNEPSEAAEARDPDDLRQRMDDYQRGVAMGRGAATPSTTGRSAGIWYGPPQHSPQDRQENE